MNEEVALQNSHTFQLSIYRHSEVQPCLQTSTAACPQFCSLYAIDTQTFSQA